MPVNARTLKLLRRKTQDSLNSFLNLVETCNNYIPLTKLRYIFDGKNYVEYDTKEDVARAITTLNNEQVAVILSTEKKNPVFAVDFYSDFLELSEVDVAEFAFNINKPLLKPDGYFSFEEFEEFFVLIIKAFKADIAYVHDSELLELITFTSERDASEDQHSESNWNDISIPESVQRTPIPLIERIGKIKPAYTFDPLGIPEAIYWFNYWSKVHVQNIGEEKIKNAPCEVIKKQENGAYLLVIQKENFDTQNLKHLEKLAIVYDYFDLYTLQEQFKIIN